MLIVCAVNSGKLCCRTYSDYKHTVSRLWINTSALLPMLLSSSARIAIANSAANRLWINTSTLLLIVRNAKSVIGSLAASKLCGNIELHLPTVLNMLTACYKTFL